jgi:phage I-like protein
MDPTLHALFLRSLDARGLVMLSQEGTVALADDEDRIYVELELSGEKKDPPMRFRMCRKGKNPTEKGEVLFDEVSAVSVMQRHAQFGNDLAIDYNHTTNYPAYLFADPAKAGEAAGWFRPEIVDGELWANVISWDAEAIERLRTKRYRYTSPVLKLEADTGRVMGVKSCALTNNPATHGLEALFTQHPTQKEPPVADATLKLFITALSMPADSTEAAVLARLQGSMQLTQTVVQLTGAPSVEAAIGVINGWKSESTKVVDLSKKLEEQEFNAVVQKGFAEKRLTPAMVEEFKRQKLSAVALSAMLPVLTPIAALDNKVQPQEKQPGAAEASVTAEDREIAMQFGNDPAEVAKLAQSKGGKVVHDASFQFDNASVSRVPRQ